MTSPSHPAAGRSRRTLWIVLAAVGVVLLCGGVWAIGRFTPAGEHTQRTTPTGGPEPRPAVTVTPAGPQPAATTRAAATTPAASSAPDRMICRVDAAGGSYYLNVTSADDHNFRACDGATPYPGTLDDLLKQPDMDRRCILPDAYTAREHAIVGVYSGAGRDLAAARAFCDANGGTQ